MLSAHIRRIILRGEGVSIPGWTPNAPISEAGLSAVWLVYIRIEWYRFTLLYEVYTFGASIRHTSCFARISKV